jgi:hypothetical protein
MNRGAVEGTTLWTEEEKRTLVDAYQRGGIAAAMRALPHRSKSSLFHAAKRAGASRRPRWTPREDERLRIEWGSLSMKELVRAFGRPRDGIYMRARDLGLPVGAPPGTEYLSHAAKRAGYCTTQLRRILRWAGVSVRESYSRTHGRRRSFHIVDPLDVDDALEAWHKTETLESAARRIGVSSETIYRRLRESGVEPRKATKRPKAHYRVATSDIDAAMSKSRAA